MTIRLLTRLVGSVLLCLAWPALVGELSLGGGGMVFYAWFILVRYGWWVYLPVVGLHQGVLQRLPRPTMWHSIGVGLVLAVLVSGALLLHEYSTSFSTSTMPRFSLHRTLDLVNYAIAGALYGGLFWRWVRPMPIRP
jgi:hypothetical protein